MSLSLIHIYLWEAQQQLKRPDTRTGKIRALQESAALFSFLQANGIQSMQQLHEKISDMNTRYYDLRGEIVKAERRVAVLTERGEMWAQYNEYKACLLYTSRTLSPVPFPAAPFRFSRKNLNGGKADGSHHQL